MHQTDMNKEALQPRPTETPFSTFLWATVSGDLATAEAQLADDIKWDLMPYNHILKGEKGDRSMAEGRSVRFSKRASRQKQLCHQGMGGSLRSGISALLPKTRSSSANKWGGRFRETRTISLAGDTKWPSATCITSMRRAR